MDMVHNNRVRGAGIRHDGPQHSHVHLQVVEEAAVRALPPGLHDGDVPCDRTSPDVFGGATRTGRYQRGDVDQLRMLRSRIAR